MNQADKWFLRMFAAFIFVLVGIAIILYPMKTEVERVSSEVREMSQYFDNFKRAQMYGLNEEELKRINGVYFPGNYFAVWVGERNRQMINRTYNHEVCHDFIHNNREHFCK